MAKSKKRRRREQRRDSRPRPNHDADGSLQIPDGELDLMLASQDRVLHAEAMAAEQHADLEYALDCVQHMARPPGGRWASQLAEMIELGEEAEHWHWARLAVASAGRWVAAAPVPLVARAHREIAEASEGAEGSLVQEYPGWVAGKAAFPSALADFILFDQLMIDVFLVQCAPRLAERAGGARTWAEAPGRVYELTGADGIELHVRDHGDGTVETVRHLSEMVGLSPGDLVYGRLVEVPGDPALIFAAPPIVVDEVVALRLTREPDVDVFLAGETYESRCATLGAAVRSGNRHRRSADGETVGAGDEDSAIISLLATDEQADPPAG